MHAVVFLHHLFSVLNKPFALKNHVAMQWVHIEAAA